MPPVGPIAKRIEFNRREAQRLHRAAQRLHQKAAALGQSALTVKASGHDVRAKRLLMRALETKAEAVKARMGAMRHRRRIVELKAIRRLNLKKKKLERLADKVAGRTSRRF